MQHLKLRRNGLFVAPALRVACIIFFLSFLWIFFSDRAIALLTDDPLKITRFQTIKGWIYISLISIIIFFLVKREIGQRDKLIGLLNESREWYNLLIANLPGVDVMLFDQDGSILLTHCEHLVGKQLISPHHPNDRIGSVISNEDLKSMVFSTMESVANKRDIIEEMRIGENSLRLYGTPLVSSGGRLVAGMIIFQDMSEQHQILNEIITKRDQYEGLYEEHLAMENELRHVNTELMSLNRELVTNEEKYRLFFENINDAAFIYEFDKYLQEGKFLEVNNIMASQLEYSTEELLLANLQAIFWDTEEIENAISTLLNGQKKLKFDTFLRSKSDRAIPAEISFYLTEYAGLAIDR